MTQDLLPHAVGEESTLYAAARSANPDLIASMIDEHGDLRRLVEACRTITASLPATAPPATAPYEERLRLLSLAHEVSALFQTHARKEDTYLMPILRRVLPGGELGRLFVAMHAAAPA